MCNTVNRHAGVAFFLLPRVSRSSLLNHMAREHSFSIGLPDNIVYCKQFLETLQNKLDGSVHPDPGLELDRPWLFGIHLSSSVSLQCLYCEKTFRDKTTLRDHMRKKSHRRINASNRDYDCFYIINYLVRKLLIGSG